MPSGIRRAAAARRKGSSASDRVANLYPLAGFPTGAFLSVIRSCMIAGLPVVHGLTGAANSEFKVRNSLAEALDTVARFRPTVLWGVPSFIRRFLDEACRRGADLSEVRLVLTSGEPMPATLKAELREYLARLGAAAVGIRARYAFTEMQGGLVQCAENAQAQNLCPDLYHLEVVDPDTGRRLADGESGALAITHLHRRGTVLLRYLVGDIVTLARTPCPLCGREGERVVATPRRTGSLVKCRGMLVNTDVILDTLSAMAGMGEFQVVFADEDRPGAMERLVIRIEREADTVLRDEVTRRVREAVSLRPEVEFVARGTLYDHERSIKAKRVLDLRANEDMMDPSAAGTSFPPYEFHVERGKIREFADAIGDPNPIYRDPAYAAKKGFPASSRRRRCCGRFSTSPRRHRRP